MRNRLRPLFCSIILCLSLVVCASAAVTSSISYNESEGIVELTLTDLEANRAFPLISVQNSVTVFGMSSGKTDSTGSMTVNVPVGTLAAGTYTVAIFAHEDGEAELLKQFTVANASDSSGSSGGHSSSSSSKYTIRASANVGGSISPSGNVSVSRGSDKTFTITADKGYEIADVLVDGESVGAVSSYTFEKVQKAHTITVQFTGIAEGLPFSDVSSDSWYYNAVKYVYGNGMMNGVSSVSFSPSSQLTRAMLAQVLYNRENAPAVETTGVFSDVLPGHWYTNAVNWAAGKGIVSGVGDDKFAPNTPITREQLVVMLYRYVDSPEVSETSLNFSDANQVSGYALTAIRWAVAENIINGNTNGTLNPTGNATRAEVAQILMNFSIAVD